MRSLGYEGFRDSAIRFRDAGAALVLFVNPVQAGVGGWVGSVGGDSSGKAPFFFLLPKLSSEAKLKLPKLPDNFPQNTDNLPLVWCLCHNYLLPNYLDHNYLCHNYLGT